MKGLLIKDLRLISKNKKLLLVMCFFAFFLLIMQQEEMESAVISYITMLGGTMVLSTISTDEFDKSVMFMLTMPVKRSTYAVEKYVFSLLCSSISCGVVTFVCCLTSGNAWQTLQVAFVIWLVLLFFQLLIIPVTLKFGGENGRIFLMGFVVAVIGIGFAISKFNEMIFTKETVSVWTQEIFRFFNALQPVEVMVTALVGFIVCAVISIKCSIGIMEKREY